jgi:hypothetical protein
MTNPGSCNPSTIANGLLVTLTVFNAGLNQTNWQLTAPDANNITTAIHCGPGYPTATLGGSVCMATYPVGATVVITEASPAGSFGGWSYGCTPAAGKTLANSTTCQVTLGTTESNVSVGGIFN